MSAATTPAPAISLAFAQALAGILRALIAALLGDVEALPENHPDRRACAKLIAEIERVIAGLPAALASTPGTQPPAARNPRRGAPRATGRAAAPRVPFARRPSPTQRPPPAAHPRRTGVPAQSQPRAVIVSI